MSDNFDEESNNGAPVSSFQTYAAEGDLYGKQGDVRKAIEAYSKALAQRPNEKNVLVSRSRCYLALSDHHAALQDCEAALREDKDFFKARYQKAEVLYAKGDFEMALVSYHRGHLARPEMEEFRLGIQKAREAIDNSIGKNISPNDYRLDKKTDKDGQTSLIPEKSRDTSSAPGNTSTPPKRDPAHEKSIKQLLGELYTDKQYLEDFLYDKDFLANPNDNVQQLVMDGLHYLDARTEFWRQQKPIYARRKELTRSKTAAR